MSEIKYDVSKNSSQCSVTTDDSKTVRADIVNVVEGEVVYDESKGSDMATVILSDGKKVRAKIVNVLN